MTGLGSMSLSGRTAQIAHVMVGILVLLLLTLFWAYLWVR
jgi:hypothetical protein